MQALLKLVAIPLAALLLAGAGEGGRPVRVAVVSFAPAETTRTFSGSVQPRTLANLAFQVGGKVVGRPVEVGDHVRAGQLLAELDLADLQLAQQSAEAALRAAQATAANARIDLARYRRLGQNSAAYLPSEFDKRLAASQTADARLAQAARQFQLAESQRNYGSLSADADGVVTALPVQVGQVVAAGQTVATLAHTGEVEVVVDVPETRLGDIRNARSVSLAVWEAPGRALHGRVREIGALADPASRTFAVRITILDAPAGELALGMTATATFADTSMPVASLPATALTDRDGRPAVWVLDPGERRARLRPVEVAGYGGDGSVQVRAGLSPGEQVVTAGVGEIEPDMQLAPWPGTSW